MTQIGKLEPVAVQEVWPNEARDFTAWLADNLNWLAGELGMRSLTLIQKEKQVGPFWLDLLAEDDQKRKVVIENQFGRTDHDHLGKLLTYVVNLEAKIAVWISEEPRAEHLRVIQWLNEMTPEDVALFLVKIEAFKISSSSPAPKLTVLAGPSPDSKEIGKGKEELAQRHLWRKEFWTILLEEAKRINDRHPHSRVSPNRKLTDSWLSASSGIRRISYIYTILMNQAAVELYIERQDRQDNERMFDYLKGEQEQIEQIFGERLEWDRMEGRRTCRIRYTLKNLGGLADRDRWEEITRAMVQSMLRLDRAFRPHTADLKQGGQLSRQPIASSSDGRK